VVDRLNIHPANVVFDAKVGFIFDALIWHSRTTFFASTLAG
jgi:hypothetical protein